MTTLSFTPSSSYATTSATLASTSLPEDAYVLALAGLGSFYGAAASAPTNAVHLLDRASLQRVRTLPAHPNGITALRTIGRIQGRAGYALLSAGKDRTVKVWDERTGSAAITMMASRPLLCADASPDGTLVAGGTELTGDDACIHYWDPRAPAAPLRTHTSTHSDDITAVHFRPYLSPQGRNVLLSASADGLLSLSDPHEPDEDEAGVAVGSWGCSVAQCGWARDGSRVWAASDMESFSLWTDELDKLADTDIRAPELSLHSGGQTWVTDYHIASSSPCADGGTLDVFVGSNEGDVALLRTGDARAWTVEHTWTGGHTGVVRACLVDAQNGVLVTGGEDAKLHAWAYPYHSTLRSSQGTEHDVSMSTEADSDSDAMDTDTDGGGRKRGWDGRVSDGKRRRT